MDQLEENRAYDDISNRTRPGATCYPFLIIILLIYINVVVTTLKMEERFIFNEAYLDTIKSPYHSTLGLSIHYDNIDSIWASFIYANYTISTWLDSGPSANIYYPTLPESFKTTTATADSWINLNVKQSYNILQGGNISYFIRKNLTQPLLSAANLHDTLSISNRMESALKSRNFTNQMAEWSDASVESGDQGWDEAMWVEWIYENVNMKTYIYYGVLFELNLSAGFTKRTAMSTIGSMYDHDGEWTDEQWGIIWSFVVTGLLVTETVTDCFSFVNANPNQRSYNRFIMMNLMNLCIIAYCCLSAWIWIFKGVKNQPVNADFQLLIKSIWDRWIIEALLP
jgi:hypothetical protein